MIADSTIEACIEDGWRFKNKLLRKSRILTSMLHVSPYSTQCQSNFAL